MIINKPLFGQKGIIWHEKRIKISTIEMKENLERSNLLTLWFHFI